MTAACCHQGGFYLNRTQKNAIFGLAYILPSFILISVFTLIPMGMSLYFCFTKYNILQPAQWVGLENFSRLLKDKMVWKALVNTFVYTMMTVPLQTVLSLLFASVLAEHFRGRFGGFVKSSMFIPVIASTVLVGTLWSIILSSTGILNNVLKLLGGSPVFWLAKPNTAMLSVGMASATRCNTGRVCWKKRCLVTIASAAWSAASASASVAENGGRAVWPRWSCKK